MSDDVLVHGAHFVGTIPLANAEEVFRTVSGLMGDSLDRIPDGETGARKDWAWIQLPVIQQHPDIEQTVIEVPGLGEMTRMSIREGVPDDSFDLDNIGYADYATESYAMFSSLKQAGVIADHVRFQVNLPTPAAITSLTATPDAAPAIEAAYLRALRRELDQILGRIPHNQLAVQWDTCVELLMIEGCPLTPPWFDDIWPSVRDRMRELGETIPGDVQLGFHLCYGDFQHQRQVDLDDASVLVQLANTLTAATSRRIDFLHLPVRGDVDPARYLAPLADLALAPETDLYLGLITDQGGLDGARERVAAAREHVTDFGVSTECGLGRRPPEAVQPLLEIHRDLSMPRSRAADAATK